MPTIGLLGHSLAGASCGRIVEVAGYARYLIPALLVLYAVGTPGDGRPRAFDTPTGFDETPSAAPAGASA